MVNQQLYIRSYLLIALILLTAKQGIGLPADQTGSPLQTLPSGFSRTKPMNSSQAVCAAGTGRGTKLEMDRGTTTACHACDPGTGTDAQSNLCLDCTVSRCENCSLDWNTATCFSCMYGFAPSSDYSYCNPCKDGCLTCGPTTDTCITCNTSAFLYPVGPVLQGWIMDIGSCSRCPEGCTNCTSSGAARCDNCLPGFTLNARQDVCQESTSTIFKTSVANDPAKSSTTVLSRTTTITSTRTTTRSYLPNISLKFEFDIFSPSTSFSSFIFILPPNTTTETSTNIQPRRTENVKILDVIIGVCAGVGGFLLLIVIIIVGVYICRAKRLTNCCFAVSGIDMSSPNDIVARNEKGSYATLDPTTRLGETSSYAALDPATRTEALSRYTVLHSADRAQYASSPNAVMNRDRSHMTRNEIVSKHVTLYPESHIAEERVYEEI